MACVFQRNNDHDDRPLNDNARYTCKMNSFTHLLLVMETIRCNIGGASLRGTDGT